ncbi:MAG TPA: 5-oxoprolinase subunit PxpA [Chthoniobacterales bacterium]
MILNADLGEHEPASRTRALMRLIDMANIACGGHAGSIVSMTRAVKLALACGVKIGAHPGLAVEFGRGEVAISLADLAMLVLQQTTALAAIAAREGARLHHIKLHGALYHATEKSQALAHAYIETVEKFFPKLKVVALAGGRVARLAGRRAMTEVFAERGYRIDGTLIPRGESGDLIDDPREVVRRLPTLHGDTICIHADSPNALRIARVVRAVL